ncbi:TolB family protein [Snuella sedimenti]|uniref:PD40 domain-containing protein n=1 Tax=Snuella sedimenti TaxID=2798802 RepID=A0A8J7IN02_9FLAO|nr:PD40 domain-containing protein [Snuella sedimenti]MBJ6367647.1 PD40 domain-containing protein [Snuella sedimenti]
MIKLFCSLAFLVGLFGYTQDQVYRVTNSKINNEYPHFGLMYLGSNKIMFTSFLLSKSGKVKKNAGNPVLTIYEGLLSDSGDIQNSVPVKISSEHGVLNTTSATLSPDGKQLYIATQYTNKNKPKGEFKDSNFHLEIGEYVAGVGWTNFKVLPFCNPKYSYAHPALSPDGKVLFFTANIRGGKETTKGGSDIFKVAVLENGTFGEPENLGRAVNSYSREMFPFLSADNTLYFASNRPNGYGGFDIYKSKMNADGTFEASEKLPKPVNSNKDDFSLIINEQNRTGCFSSKRDGGSGDDDIYYFTR